MTSVTSLNRNDFQSPLRINLPPSALSLMTVPAEGGGGGAESALCTDGKRLSWLFGGSGTSNLDVTTICALYHVYP
jgi:hypothetical protein